MSHPLNTFCTASSPAFNEAFATGEEKLGLSCKLPINKKIITQGNTTDKVAITSLDNALKGFIENAASSSFLNLQERCSIQIFFGIILDFISNT